MKVTCAYCDSYVDVIDNNSCPCCGAPLGDAIEEAKKKLLAEQAMAEKKAAEAHKIKLEEERDQMILNALLGVASTAGGHILGHTISSGFRRRGGVGGAIIRGLIGGKGKK